MRFYHIKDDYITFLRQFDEKVPHNKFEKRPYIGVILSIEDNSYYVPLSSPKEKHQSMKNRLYFHRIKAGVLGAINLTSRP